MKNLIYCFFFLSIALVGCQKYPDGGMHRFAKSHLLGTWKLKEYYLNNFEYTQDVTVFNFKETYNDGGTFSRTFIDDAVTEHQHHGGWDLAGEKDVLKITSDSTYQITALASVLTSNFKIERLTKEELWYSFEAGNGKHELHFIKQ